MISKRRRGPLRALGLDVIRTPDQDIFAQAAAAAGRPNIVRFAGVGDVFRSHMNRSTSLDRTAARGDAAYEAPVAALRDRRGSSATEAS